VGFGIFREINVRQLIRLKTRKKSNTLCASFRLKTRRKREHSAPHSGLKPRGEQ